MSKTLLIFYLLFSGKSASGTKSLDKKVAKA